MDSTESTLQGVLDDLGRFLGETLVGEPLSPRAEVQRAGLLQRLEPHIRRSGGDVVSLTKMTPQHTDTKSMNGNIEENYEEIPAAAAAASQSRSSSSNSIKLEDTFKVNLPFKTLQNITVKCGPLWRKEKVVFLDQWRKSWTGLYGHFLLMYYTQRDVRPYDHVNVQGFVARPAPNCNKDLKRKDATFEIVCPGKRDYQFSARTAKDMYQWVTAICQVSIQHIQTSIPQLHTVPPLPHHTLDKSVLRSAKDVPAHVESDIETYDDVSSVIECNKGSELIYELAQPYEDDFYNYIPDIYQRNSRLESKPDAEVKSAEKCPPLPPRQPVRTVPRDDLSDQESVYDDAGDLNQRNGYSNMADMHVGGKHIEVQSDMNVLSEKEMHTKAQPSISVKHTKVQSQQSMKPEVQYDDNEEEEFYDEIGVPEEPPKEMKPPVLKQKYSVGNGSCIQNLIKQLEASFPKGNLPIGAHHPDSQISNKIQLNTLPKSVRNSGEHRISQITTTKPKPNTRDLHKTMKITENITFSSSQAPQTPELQPRSYLKQ